MITKISKTNFGRLNARTFYQYLKNNLSDETFYISVGYIPDSEYIDYAGTDSEGSVYFGGTVATDYDLEDAKFYSQHTMSYHKVFPGSVSPVINRVNWTKGNVYDSWPNQNSYVLVRDVESGFAKLNVYLCLFSPRTESLYSPTGTSTEAFMLDNYVWKYAYTISDSQAVKFLDSTYMPVNTQISSVEAESLKPGSDRYNQLTVQNNATAGRLYDITVSDETALESSLAAAGYTPGDVIKIYARDDSGSTPTQDLRAKVSYSALYSKHIFELDSVGEGYIGPVTFIDSDSSAELSGISSQVAPLGGFGSNPSNELNATSLKISVREINEDYESAFVNNTPFNLVNLVANPIDISSKKVAKKDFYFGCRSFETENPNNYSIGETITKDDGSGGVTANMIFQVIGVYKDRVYYISSIQGNERFKFAVGDTVSVVGTTLKDNTIKRVYDREMFFNSGNILASRYFADPIYRTKDQIESFNFIINFE